MSNTLTPLLSSLPLFFKSSTGGAYQNKITTNLIFLLLLLSPFIPQHNIFINLGMKFGNLIPLQKKLLCP